MRRSKRSNAVRDARRLRREIRVALWLFAALEAVGSARELARLCQQHDVYRWICGGVSVNYHTLADFRVGMVRCLMNCSSPA